MRKILIFITIFVLALVTNAASAQKFVLVIDAGHGGKDPGALGKNSNEKDINLSVALAFGKYVEKNCNDVKVIYTRKTDVFVKLEERANIANRNKADLFISIHTNALDGGKISRGLETYTLGMHRAADNLNVAKRENSVILMEKDYKQTYAGFDPKSAESYIMFELMQDKNMSNSVEMAKFIQNEVCSSSGRVNKGVHQAGFLVLRETSMPSCLIELGFITTPDEEEFLNTKDGQDKLAKGIYNAFVKYKKKYGHHRISENSDDNTPSDNNLMAEADNNGKADVTETDVVREDSTSMTTMVEFAEQRAVRQIVLPEVAAVVDNDIAANIPDEEIVSKGSETTVAHNEPIATPAAPAASQTPAASPTPKNDVQPPPQPTSQPLPEKHIQQVSQPQQPIAVAQQQPVKTEQQQQPAQQPGKTEQQQQPAQQPTQSTPKQQPVQQPAQSTPKQQPAQGNASNNTIQKNNTTLDATNPAAVPNNQVRNNSQKNTKKAENAPQAPVSDKENTPKTIFKVQIAATSEDKPKDNTFFTGLDNVDSFKENGMVKYTVGSSEDFAVIQETKNSISDRYPGAFIIAFRNGEKISVQEAMKEYRKN